jgi:hypothetical protein
MKSEDIESICEEWEGYAKEWDEFEIAAKGTDMEKECAARAETFRVCILKLKTQNS